MNRLQERRQNIVGPRNVRRKKLSVPAGRSISAEELYLQGEELPECDPSQKLPVFHKRGRPEKTTPLDILSYLSEDSN